MKEILSGIITFFIGIILIQTLGSTLDIPLAGAWIGLLTFLLFLWLFKEVLS